MTASRFEFKLAQAMAKDVESWAKGGEGCLLRAHLPPVPAVASKSGSAPKPNSPGKGQSASGGKKR
jgi:hypothetical protein